MKSSPWSSPGGWYAAGFSFPCLSLFPFHIHIQLAALRLIQHLFQALLLCFCAFRAEDAKRANVIALLVIGSFMIRIHQFALGQRRADVVGHFMMGTSERHGLLRFRDDCDCVDLCQEIGVSQSRNKYHRDHRRIRVIAPDPLKGGEAFLKRLPLEDKYVQLGNVLKLKP